MNRIDTFDMHQLRMIFNCMIIDISNDRFRILSRTKEWRKGRFNTLEGGRERVNEVFVLTISPSFGELLVLHLAMMDSLRLIVVDQYLKKTRFLGYRWSFFYLTRWFHTRSNWRFRWCENIRWCRRRSRWCYRLDMIGILGDIVRCWIIF